MPGSLVRLGFRIRLRAERSPNLSILGCYLLMGRGVEGESGKSGRGVSSSRGVKCMGTL